MLEDRIPAQAGYALASLDAHLNQMKIPPYIILVEHIPGTRVGKYDRRPCDHQSIPHDLRGHVGEVNQHSQSRLFKDD